MKNTKINVLGTEYTINEATENEELVDWLAIQWHKINAIFDQLGI